MDFLWFSIVFLSKTLKISVSKGSKSHLQGLRRAAEERSWAVEDQEAEASAAIGRAQREADSERLWSHLSTAYILEE